MEATRLTSLIPNESSSSPAISIEERTAKDPLKIFGLLTPQSLKAAQNDAVRTVQELVPRLCEVDAEMKEVEIQIRRARKHRSKAEALVGKEGGVGTDVKEVLAV
jgi:uncharacterized small protein (DUF1192 family)